jgi:hypothetical protein
MKTMDNSSAGLSNPYLKIGAAFVIAALVAIAWTSFFSTDRELQAIVRNVGGLLLLSGMVIYAIGRVVRARRSRTRNGA